MKDHNHDLVQALHHAMDQAWRAEKHYLPAAQGCEQCQSVWKAVAHDNRKHEMLLRDEIISHAKEDRFN